MSMMSSDVNMAGAGAGAGGPASVAVGAAPSLVLTTPDGVKSAIASSVEELKQAMQQYERRHGSGPNSASTEDDRALIYSHLAFLTQCVNVYMALVESQFRQGDASASYLNSEADYIRRQVEQIVAFMRDNQKNILRINTGEVASTPSGAAYRLNAYVTALSASSVQFYEMVRQLGKPELREGDLLRLAEEEQALRHQEKIAQIEHNARFGQLKIESDRAVAIDSNARASAARVDQTKERMAAVNKNLKLLLAGGSLATVGVLAAYFMFRKYAQTKPKIIEDGDTSISTLFKKAKFPEPRLDSLVLTPELEHLVRNKFEALEIAILNKLPLSNMMFYGPPGTGKTMAAQEFMRHLSKLGIADHIIIRGPAFRRFSTTSEAIDALASMLRFALHSYRKRKRPCLVFFDEADVLFADRLNPAISTDISRNAVVTLTSLLPAAISKEIMCIFSANNKKDFDIAIFDRVDPSNQIYFPLPGQKERETLLRLYLNEHVVKNGLVVAPEVDAHIGDVAQKLQGLSGRQISSTVVQSMYPLLNKGETELTLPLLEGVIRDRVRAQG